MTNAPQQHEIGKYRIIANLASGSQGTVYRAYDPTLEREVALKVLHPHLATPDVVERFRREGRIVASISHPNIAVISEIGEHNGSHFIAIEYVPHSAGELIRRGPVDVGLAVSIAHQTALALEAARVSRHGITHHDVKPDNLLLTSLDAGGMVKLIDFGIAHAEGMASMTQTGSQWGTPFYMPPEQWAGERGDTRSDVYSLGVVMYQALAGHVPFDSDAENALARQKTISDQHLSAAPAPLRSVREDVPEELDSIVAKCMAKSPAERYQTPGELANALAEAFGLAAPSATVAGAPSPPAQTVQESPATSADARRPSPPPSPRPYQPHRQSPPIFDRLPPILRNRPLLAAGIAVAFLAIITLVIIASRPTDVGPPPRVIVVAPPDTPTPTPAPSRTRGAGSSQSSAPAPTATPTPAVSAADFIRAALADPAPTRTPAPVFAPTATPTRTPAPTSTPAPAPALPTMIPTPDNPNALADLRPVPDSFNWSPRGPSVGDMITFTVEIRNRGRRHAGASVLAYSIDGIDGAKTGEVDIPPIPAGGSAEASFAWRAEAGHHNVALEVDAENHVRESSEGDNAIVQGLIYYGTALADLSVASIEWEPKNPELGEEVTFTATVSNAGDGRAAASKLLFQVDGESAGAKLMPPISPGETARADFTWTAQAGEHVILVAADDNQTVSETNVNNNKSSILYDATVFVDLFVEGITWTPEKPSVGDAVAFSVTVGNGGNMDAGEFAAVLLGEDTLTGSDIFEKPVILSGVPAGGSSVVEFEWTAAPGAMNLVAVANARETLTEIDLDNNALSKVYDSTALPDLVVDKIAWSPENPALGDEVAVTLTVKNKGAGRASAASVRYVVGEDALSGNLDIPALESGASADAAFAWTAERGEHEFSAFVNPNESPIETDYGNNESSAIYDNTRLANLTVDSATWSPKNPAAGDALTFSAAIRNAGDADAPAFRVEFRDEAGGWRLDDFAFPNGIAAGASANATFTWTADANAHSFVVKADSLNAVDESDESDNTHRFAYDDTRTADLFIKDIGWNPQTPTVGQNVIISVIVENGGPGDAGASVVRFVIDGPSRSEETIRMPAIAAGGSAIRSFNWSAGPGEFTFTATADANSQIPETDEGNNTRVRNYNDTALADLEVVGINVDWKPPAGTEISVRVNIRNRGDADAGPFKVSLGVNGLAEGYASVNGLRAGRQDLAFIDITWPSGPVRFSATVDSDNDVPEKSETNNWYRSNTVH